MAATSGGSHLGGSNNLFKDRKYCRENTVVVNVRDNSLIKPEGIIQFVNENCGLGSLYACVPKSGNLYELTLDGKAPTQYLLEGIRLGNDLFECREVVQTSLIVSFLHLPAYIDDGEIEQTLTSMGVELLSPINRRFYPGTTIADGTRYVKVKLPPHMPSFPCTVKFQKEYHRCIHNGQMKVCSLCYVSDHLFRACPKFVCFKCKQQGHYARACKNHLCEQCGEWTFKCQCCMSDHSSEENNELEVSEVEKEDVLEGNTKMETEEANEGVQHENENIDESLICAETKQKKHTETTENQIIVNKNDQVNMSTNKNAPKDGENEIQERELNEASQDCENMIQGRSESDSNVGTDSENEIIIVEGKAKRKKKLKKKRNAKKNK
ncbi:uncharacterized protein LOC125680821 [Ostrea edulis]|uniref:uncharacterized protein LOC125680821 n=1 Tax=Ostrea edulis TaxID=37623 RepID=UPI0024AFDEED|nr:uncharacterized protein LOC125680821 [Ostrea edulis]